ncbi:MAG TPA: phosphoglucomutase/phosphomannomutase family protein [Clostridiales bacterium]|nr:phosphoglucomutase/phosphomannomutase family protein [Clostridiales bacterium]
MIKFGTGGWRELIGEGFTKSNVQLIAQAMCSFLDDTGIVIGYDRRFLSDSAAVWAAEVFAANRKKVWFIDRVAPTPLVMFTVQNKGISYGMAVTASHNPAKYNGIKVFAHGGKDADRNLTDRIEEEITRVKEVKSITFGEGLAKGYIEKINPMNEYIDAIINQIDMESIRKAGLRLAIDPMFGVSRTALLNVLITARCDVAIINDRHDTLFGGRLPSPEAATLHKLRDVVIENGYDLGIATDGDADRIGIIDSKGNYVHPNMLLAILYYYLLKYKKQTGDVVRNVATTHILDAIAKDFGQQSHEVPVGFKNISAKMEETNALVGGESSGGLTIRGHINGKDGIFAAALLVEIVAVSGKSLADYWSEIENRYGKHYWVETSYGYSAEKRGELMDILFKQKKLPEFEEKISRVSYEDGVKVYFENGDWVITRFSGTEPLIRVFSESSNKDTAEKYAKRFQEYLHLDQES